MDLRTVYYIKKRVKEESLVHVCYEQLDGLAGEPASFPSLIRLSVSDLTCDAWLIVLIEWFNNNSQNRNGQNGSTVDGKLK